MSCFYSAVDCEIKHVLCSGIFTAPSHGDAVLVRHPLY